MTQSTETRPSETQHSEPPGSGALVAVFLAFALLLFFGGLYLDLYSGGFNPIVYQPFQNEDEVRARLPRTGADVMAKGKKLYSQSCGPCHQATGQGLPGQFPPLAGSEWAVGDGANRMIRIVLDGMTGPLTVKGVQYNNTMVPWRDVLKDEDIAAVLSYVRNEWGNKASVVEPEQVQRIRQETSSRAGQPWTADELAQIREAD